MTRRDSSTIWNRVVRISPAVSHARHESGELVVPKAQKIKLGRRVGGIRHGTTHRSYRAGVIQESDNERLIGMANGMDHVNPLNIVWLFNKETRATKITVISRLVHTDGESETELSSPPCVLYPPSSAFQPGHSALSSDTDDIR